MSLSPIKRKNKKLGSGLESADSLANENAVVFRGDGEPKAPQLLLRQLAEVESDIGLDPDFYSQGGNVAELEQHFAEILGKETAVFMPTGTLANHLALRALCGTKPRAIVQEQSHLYHDSGDCVTQLSGINLVPLAKGRCYFTLEELKESFDESVSGRVSSAVGAVMIESPVRRQMEQVVPFQEMKAIADYCNTQRVATHLDGARLYMMSAASGIKPKEYAALFDTVYVSLYKYFGAPFGAILAGSSQHLDGMFHTRRMFGGGLASSYLAAGLALKGVQGFEERFGQAMLKAKELFNSINDLPNIHVREFEHGSNVFPLTFDADVDTGKVAHGLRENNIHLYPDEGSESITRLTVNTTILRQSNEAIFGAFKDVLASVAASTQSVGQHADNS